eukprot:3366398-Prymnesium_polylepis.3
MRFRIPSNGDGTSSSGLTTGSSSSAAGVETRLLPATWRAKSPSEPPRAHCCRLPPVVSWAAALQRMASERRRSC